MSCTLSLLSLQFVAQEILAVSLKQEDSVGTATVFKKECGISGQKKNTQFQLFQFLALRPSLNPVIFSIFISMDIIALINIYLYKLIDGNT